MTETRTLETEQIDFIKLSDLKLSPDNMRTDKTNGADDAMMKASLASQGVIHNLLVHPMGKGFGVAGGGRRLKLLKELAKEGTIDKDYQVPCRIVDRADALRLSTAENTHRVNAHPVDEFFAYQKLVTQKGATQASIAAEFGVSEKYVQQRLALAKVHPEILEAYRDPESKINMERVQAYAIEPDQQKQQKVFRQLGEWTTAYNIRHYLTESQTDTDDKYARFVGLDAYREAGGGVTEDIFEETFLIHDGELLMELALKKVDTYRQKYLGEGFKWVKTVLDNGWFERWQYEKRTGKLSAEDKAECGVYIDIDEHGKIQTEKGFYKAKAEKSSTGSTTAKKQFSQAVCHDLGVMRQTIAKQHLAAKSDPAYAIRCLHFAVVDKVFRDRSWDTSCITITLSNWDTKTVQDAVADIEIPSGNNAAARFKQFRALPQDQQDRLVAAATASLLALNEYDKNDHLVNLWLEEQTPDYLEEVRLTTDNFFGRIKAGQITEILAKFLSADRMKKLAPLKAKDLKKFAGDLFNKQTSWEAEGLTERPRYLPPGFTEVIR